LWEKGATSGNRQRLRQIEMDCDRDALRFTVEQLAEGFCHTGSYGCFGDDRSLSMIERHLASRLNGNDRQSVTWQLANHPERLREKLIEEVDELLTSTDPENADWEFADILYFALIALKSRGGNVEGALQELGRRSRRVTRRKAKGEIC
jgi:phosphoribosyl-ATP pyrophosphohydrolase